MDKKHIPVLLDEVIKYLEPKQGGVYIDCTFGAGGYSRGLLENMDCTLYAIDRDATVKQYADNLAQEFGNRFKFLQGNFKDIQTLIGADMIGKIDGIIFDVGVSSMQIDNAERGFSFMQDGDLDMRMGEGELTAKYIVNHYSEEEIANIIYHYGGERKSRRIAHNIVEYRKTNAINTTKELVTLIEQAVGRYHDKIHPATRSFQALRIVVNDELNNLKQALIEAEKMLIKGGKLAIVTFHSLEDVIVKQFFKERIHKIKYNKYDALSKFKGDADGLVQSEKESVFKMLHKSVIVPTRAEIKQNVRARSAKLRAAEKLMV